MSESASQQVGKSARAGSLASEVSADPLTRCIRIRIQCAEQAEHAKILRLDAAKGAIYARDIAELVCGISPLYIYPPGDKSPIGKCATCGGKLGYTLEELGSPETWEFDGYRLRATMAGDLGLAAEWTAADPAHAGLDPAFWLEQGPSRQSYLLWDGEGPVFFFKSVLHHNWIEFPAPALPIGAVKPGDDVLSEVILPQSIGRVLEVFIQFPPQPPEPHGDARFKHKFRIGKALVAGTAWLEKRMAGVVDVLAFDSVSPSLVHFCIDRLGFAEYGGRLRKNVQVMAVR